MAEAAVERAGGVLGGEVDWLHLLYAETIYAQNMPSLTLAQAEYYQRRIDVAERRYLRAIKTLAQVRRLLVPIVQVNIAEKQLNVAAEGLSQVQSMPSKPVLPPLRGAITGR